MTDDISTKARQVEAGAGRRKCDHICLLEDGHGGGHFYGYERPSPREWRERAEKAEAQLAQVTQDRDDLKLQVVAATETRRAVAREAASLREALEEIRALDRADSTNRDSDDFERIQEIAAAALTPTQQEPFIGADPGIEVGGTTHRTQQEEPNE